MAPSKQMYLAEDLMLKIYSLLPVSSLLRFRCVCRSWNRIISNQSFVNAYAKTSLNANKYLLFDLSSCYSLCLVDNETCSDVEAYSSEEYYIAKSFCSTPHWRVKIYGICKGLLCMSDDPLKIDSPIHLWNPIVRKSKNLPESKVCIDPASASGTFLSLGYYNDEYKVIKIITTDFIGRLVFSIQVYSLNTNCWRIIYCDKQNITYRCASDPRLVKDALYFFNDAINITSFDLRDGTVREIKIPEEIVNARTLTLEAYEESIAVLDFYPRKYKCLVMWVLRCDGKGFYLWEKKFDIVFEHGPQIGIKNDINIRYIDHSTLFFLWDTGTENWKGLRFPLEQRDLIKKVFGIKSFEESLALLNETTSTRPIKKEMHKPTNPIRLRSTVHVGGRMTFISATDSFLPGWLKGF